MNDIRTLSVSLCNWRVTVRALSTTKISRRCERALMRFEGKLAGMKHRASYRSWETKRVSSVNITSIRVWRCGTRVGGWEGEGESGKQGWCRLLSRGTPEPRSPLRAGPAVPVLLRVARKYMKTSTHSPSPASAKLHDLRVLSAPKLFPANHKNSPSSPANPSRPPPRKTPSVFCIVTFSRLTRRAVHCFNRIASTLNRH